MLTVNVSHFTADGQGGLIAEASDLGLPPGEWPSMLRVYDPATTTVFKRGEPRVRGDDLAAYTYTAPSGTYLLVVND